MGVAESNRNSRGPSFSLKPASAKQIWSPIVRTWLEQWIPDLASIPVRLADEVEHARRWARYEEFHPDSSERDAHAYAARELAAVRTELPLLFEEIDHADD